MVSITPKSLEELVRIVGEVCGEFEECVYALVFGSRATKTQKPYSDLDVAVMFKGGTEKPLELAQELAFKIEERTGVKVDVVPLNLADTILRYEVFRDGILAFCRDHNRYWDDKVNSVDKYLDFKRVLDRHYKRVVREIMDAASGR